jgi:hypothetical protein
LLVVPAIVLAGCSGGGKHASQTQTQSTAPEGALLKNCSSLGQNDIERVAGISPVNRRHLSSQPGAHLLCGMVFFDGSGDLIVEITETPGGGAALRRLRISSAEQFGRADVRPVSSLGPTAFLARRRILAFARGGRIVKLETGYGSQGTLSLTVDQLTRLARLVASRD